MNEEEEKINLRSSQKYIRSGTNNLHEKLLNEELPAADFIDPLND